MLNRNTEAPILPNRCYQQCFLSDNLELMKTIESNTIDLIYCDILYGTGRKFKDYQDLKPNRIEIENHYIPRLKEMHRILKPTGSIYLQMDTKINHWVRCIMDDIFGYENFKNEIVWKRSKPMNQKYNHFAKTKDHILFYSKSKKHKFNQIYENIENENTIKRYDKIDEKGKVYMLMNLLSSKNFKINNDIRIVNGVSYINKSGLGWAMSQKAIDKRINEGYIFEVSSTGNLCYRSYYQGKKQITEMWETNLNPVLKQVYDTEKPKSLIERIIKASSNEGDLVADFYAGSFTTAEVCKELNRNFIGCDINPLGLEISKKRLNK